MVLNPLRFIQATLLFVPTTFVVPNVGLVAFALFSIIVYQPSFHRTDRLFFAFAIAVFANAVLGIAIEQNFPESIFVNNGLVGAIILLLAYLSAQTLSDTTLKLLLLFVIFEAIVLIFQVALGVRYFFESQAMYLPTNVEFQPGQNIGDMDLLYFVRPMGLSQSSSIVASKIFLGLLLTYLVPMRRTFKLAIMAFLFAALITSFRRSNIASAAIFFVILVLLDIRNNGWRFRHSLLAGALIASATLYTTAILVQLTRNFASTINEINIDLLILQLSGRAEIWQETVEFISHHLFFGNFSTRYQISTGHYPHSSYFSLLSTHGLFVSVLAMSFIIRKLRAKPQCFVLMVPLLFNSIFSDDLFWYISVFDIFVLYLLTQAQPSAAWGFSFRPSVRFSLLPQPPKTIPDTAS